MSAQFFPYRAAGKVGNMTLTTRQVAEEIGVPPKRLRYFLRKTGAAHTSEGRYAFEARQLRRLKKQYEAWHA